MNPYHYSMLGLALDIVGAFLLSVEAIKLENLRALRDSIFRRAHELTLSPRIVFVDETGQPIGPMPTPVPANRYVGLFMGLHYVAGLFLLVVANELLGGWLHRQFIVGASCVIDRPWYLAILLILAFLIIGVVAGLWMLGELVHMALTGITRASIKIVDWIDASAPNGTVGLIGFFLLLVGFLLQMYGTYIGGQAPP